MVRSETERRRRQLPPTPPREDTANDLEEDPLPPIPNDEEEDLRSTLLTPSSPQSDRRSEADSTHELVSGELASVPAGAGAAAAAAVENDPVYNHLVTAGMNGIGAAPPGDPFAQQQHPKIDVGAGGYATTWRSPSQPTGDDARGGPKGPEEENIKVFLRMCGGKAAPAPGAVRCIEPSVDSPNAIVTPNGKTWTFDGVMDEFASQEGVYDTVARQFVPSVFEGKSAAVMCYGQTGSGKTHSMIGPAKVVGGQVDTASAADSLIVGSEDDGLVLSPDAGIAPRVCQELFRRASVLSATVSVSFLEIYCENVVDLLAGVHRKDQGLVADGRPRNEQPWMASDRPMSAHRRSLTIVGSESTITVQDATACNIQSAEEALQLLRLGMEARVTASTKCNLVSSRGHAIMVLTVERTMDSRLLRGQFYLCDLAGSEKVKKTEATGLRLAEASRINTSLLTLRRCIDLLAVGRDRGYVPFRDSKLTRLLKNALGGSGRAAILCTVNARISEEEEAMSTLRFAAAAATVSNSVEANIVERSAEEWKRLLTAATRTIIRLESQLAMYKKQTVVVAHAASADAGPDTLFSIPVVSSDLTCPLSHSLFSIPVVAMDGRTYEKACILEHFRKSGVTSPVDGTHLESALLIPNRTVAVQAARVRKAYEEAYHRGVATEMPLEWAFDGGCSQKAVTLLDMPSELIHHVCRWFTPMELNALSATCRQLYHDMKSPIIWSTALRAHFGPSAHAMQKMNLFREGNPEADPKDVYVHVYSSLTWGGLSGLPEWLRTAIHRSLSRRQQLEERRRAFLRGTIPHATNLQLI